MKIVIEVDEETYDGITGSTIWRDCEQQALDDIRNGTPLPKDATNGDIFRAMFSNLAIYENRNNKDYPYVDVFIGEHDSTCYPKDWWNAPYKEEWEDKK